MAKAATYSFSTPRTIRGQKVLSETDRSRPFFLIVLSGLLTLVILGAIFYIGLRVKVVSMGYHINQEIQNKERMIEENKRLSLEIARLKSPTRIETEAKETLGLQVPEPHQIIYFGDNTEGFDQALAKIKPLSSSPAVSNAAPSPAAKPKKNEMSIAKKTLNPKENTLSVEKKSQSNSSKVSVTEKKNKNEAAESKPVSEKPMTSSRVLVAKIIKKKAPETPAAPKTSTLKVRSTPLREGIPAAMLDTIP